MVGVRVEMAVILFKTLVVVFIQAVAVAVPEVTRAMAVMAVME